MSFCYSVTKPYEYYDGLMPAAVFFSFYVTVRYPTLLSKLHSLDEQCPIYLIIFIIRIYRPASGSPPDAAYFFFVHGCWIGGFRIGGIDRTGATRAGIKAHAID